MANDKQPQENIERARDLLSPYLDDEISTEERALVEQAIAGSSELRRELETLRQTISLVAALPPMPAPRPFTLSEADVRPVQLPARRGFFSLPIWVGSAALVAATLICVVAIGGVYFNGLFGAGQLAPASEIALQQDQAASEPAPAEAPAAAGAAAEDTFREEGEPAQEIAPAVEEPAEEESVEMMAEQEAEGGAEKELLVEEEAEVLESEAMEAESIEEPSEEEAAPAQENRASAGDEADTMTDGAGEAAAAAPPQPATASPLPLVQATPAPAPTAVMQATSIAEAQAAPATAGEAAPAVPPVDQDEAQKLPSEIASEPGDDNAARLVEIQDRTLSVTPGLIELTGSIEVEPGSVLAASLRRNGALFDDWADPGTLQTVVQPGGRFMFAIQARSDRTDQTLYSTEPVTYEIIITSIGADVPSTGPVTVVIPFDMSAIPAPLATPDATATPLPTSTPPPTSTPAPTASVIARVEPAAPTPTVIPETGQQTTATAPASQNRPGRLIITAIALILGLLVIIGLIGFWWIVRKQRG
jgi:hypothetical protein